MSSIPTRNSSALFKTILKITSLILILLIRLIDVLEKIKKEEEDDKNEEKEGDEEDKKGDEYYEHVIKMFKVDRYLEDDPIIEWIYHFNVWVEKLERDDIRRCYLWEMLGKQLLLSNFFPFSALCKPLKTFFHL